VNTTGSRELRNDKTATLRAGDSRLIALSQYMLMFFGTDGVLIRITAASEA
jgi:hypothetical protein